MRAAVAAAAQNSAKLIMFQRDRAIGLAIFLSWCAFPALSQSDIATAAERLAEVTAEADKRNDVFMSELTQRVTDLKLESLLAPANLATDPGRAGIRRGFTALSRILDEIETFGIAEEVKLKKSVDETVIQLEPHKAQDLQLGFERGHARMRARYSALYRLQRASIDTTFELVDLVERAPGGVKLVGGKMRFADPGTLASAEDLLNRLAELEEAEARAQRDIDEARRQSSQRAQKMLK